ncbi:MAG: hypothetical protein F4Y16_08155 [Holophagales bacterium]|nr:hypothetical protein [Holophagales bacterium]MYH24566.1 hypothetical protein [Holophagales bacterium]
MKNLIEWTRPVVFAVLLCGSVAEATAQVSPSTTRRLPAELRHLEDCHLLDGATLDVLRHGYVVVHRDKIIAEEREGREALSFLLGALSGADMLDPLAGNLIDGATSFQWAGALSEYVASRESQREALRKDFRTAVRAGLRQRCTVFGSDRAWSYAPSYGSECAGLTNEPVDRLRHSGEFFGLDRWKVRISILDRYRLEGRPGTCQEFAEDMASRAWILDP